MSQILRFNKVIKSFIIIWDLCLLNIIFIVLYYEFDCQPLSDEFKHSLILLLTLLSLIYLLCNYSVGIILHDRIVRPERIVGCALRNMVLHALLFISLVSLSDIAPISARACVAFYSCFFLHLVVNRLTFRYLLKKYRSRGGNSRSVILVGSNTNMADLYHQMVGDPTTGFCIKGYFNNLPTGHFPPSVTYLGQPAKVVAYLQVNPTEQVYCCLPSMHSHEIIPIINYCEDHLIHFFSVPNVHNYLHRRMHFEMFGSVPVLCIREEPLSQIENRLLKRAFDLFFSGLFLCTLFPFIYLIIGAAIKCSSPGPVFFKQRRSGEHGKEFTCYKFRSMRSNADSDSSQTTVHDVRKTPIGNFMRRTSIDELPQFINVFLGQMSVVGPRPHMLRHTEDYSRLIDKYMVRHLVKPGITGWAQVTGYRGETRELWQMEGRVQRDVWYLEHWNFLLDVYIVYKTIKNAIRGEKEAY